jgi:alpha-beta hydrolase superfamily lysophospholipase
MLGIGQVEDHCGMPSQTDAVVARDGTPLFTRTWPARPAGEPWALVLLVHGVAEHTGRYEDVGEWLAGAGLEVQAYDHRDFGRSGGRRGHVERWSQLLSDLQERVVALRRPGLPFVLYGHSMGGLICAEYCEGDRPQPDLLVLSAPGLASGHPRYLHWLAAVLGRVTPRWAPPLPLGDFSVLSRDPAVAEAFANDPLAVHNQTARFGLEAFTAQSRASAAVGRIRIPTLVIHGEEDRLVPPHASAGLARLPNVERRLYPGLRHELHNEPEGRRIVGEVIDWMRTQVACMGEDASV